MVPTYCRYLLLILLMIGMFGGAIGSASAHLAEVGTMAAEFKDHGHAHRADLATIFHGHAEGINDHSHEVPGLPFVMVLPELHVGSIDRSNPLPLSVTPQYFSFERPPRG
jgi:hypothetical protein